MKYLMILALIPYTLISCSDDEVFSPDDLIGTWKLVEAQSSNGDESFSALEITGKEKIAFFSNEKFQSSTILCSFGSTNNSTENVGTYDPAQMVISLENCGHDIRYNYEDSNLVLKLPCDEGCIFKYTKLSDQTSE